MYKSLRATLEQENRRRTGLGPGVLPTLIKHVVVIIVVVVVRLHKVLDLLLGSARSLPGRSFGGAQAAAVLLLLLVVRRRLRRFLKSRSTFTLRRCDELREIGTTT